MIERSRLKVGMRVRYCADFPHLCEDGTVSSWNDRFVFVKYDNAVHKHGLDGATAEATSPSTLEEIDYEHNDRINND